MGILSSFTALWKKREVSSTRLTMAVSLFFIVVYNRSFFQHVIEVYPVSWQNIWFLLSLATGVTLVIALFITLLSSKYTTKPLLVLLFIASSLSVYFAEKYHVVIDYIMIRNITETNYLETYDLLNLKILCYVFFLGLIPSLFLYRIQITDVSLKKAVAYKLRDVFLILLLIFILLLSSNKFYTSFFREHQELRYYVNPIYYVYSFGKYMSKEVFVRKKAFVQIGTDATMSEPKGSKKKIVFFIVGEAARADHFSLNGYQRETNPLLKKEGVIDFSNVYSCGTSTAYSVPCMFSSFPQAEFNSNKGEEYGNVLDVLQNTGSVDILWRDNNSDSKGVAVRVPCQDYRSPDLNTMCLKEECRDAGMLVGLDQYVSQHDSKNILIVLHQMGNHGPAYYKRYPKQFEQFTPACQTNEFEKCSRSEIINAYDNALLYTDYFLDQVIRFLKKYNDTHEVAMLYFSDHGESLGENGVYLHGIPYIIAPEVQTHIGALMWLGDDFKKKLPVKSILAHRNDKYSHDNVFHTLLGLFQIKTTLYNKKLDIFADE